MLGRMLQSLTPSTIAFATVTQGRQFNQEVYYHRSRRTIWDFISVLRVDFIDNVAKIAARECNRTCAKRFHRAQLIVQKGMGVLSGTVERDEENA